MTRLGAAVGLIVTLAIVGCGGGSKSAARPQRVGTDTERPLPATTTTAPTTTPVRASPAQFGSAATRVCARVAPRLKRTVDEVNMVNSANGNPVAKLPKLSRLLKEISGEFGALHAGLAPLRAPASRRAVFAAYLRDLTALRNLSATMAADLRTGTIKGLNRYRPLASRFSARAGVLEYHRKKLLPHNACRNLGA